MKMQLQLKLENENGVKIENAIEAKESELQQKLNGKLKREQ